MTDEAPAPAEIPLQHLLDPRSPHYTEAWPDVTGGVIGILEIIMPNAANGHGPTFIIANAPPFKFKMNVSMRVVRHERETYGPGELAFHRDGAKVASISWLAGPQGVLQLWLEDGATLTESHRLEKGRQLEDEIIEALKRERARLRT